MSLSKKDCYSLVILVVLCLVVLIGISALYFIPKWELERKHQAEQAVATEKFRAEQAAAAEKIQAEREKNVVAFVEKRKAEEKQRADEAARQEQEA